MIKKRGAQIIKATLHDIENSISDLYLKMFLQRSRRLNASWTQLLDSIYSNRENMNIIG